MNKLLWLLILNVMVIAADDYIVRKDNQYDPYKSKGSGIGTLDDERLHLSVAVTDEYVVIGARGGFMPCVYYRVLKSKQSNRYAAIQKDSKEDSGRVIWAVYSSRNGKPDSAYVDENNRFLAFPGDGSLGLRPPEDLTKPDAGTVLATISPNSARTLRQREAEEAVIVPLSVFDTIAKDLVAIHSHFIDLEDVNDITLMIDNDFFGNDKLHELRPLMSALKEAGFRNISLAVSNDDEEFWYRVYKEAYEELYSPFGLKPPSMGASSSSYLKNQKFAKDIDKVLKDVAGLQTTGKTVLGGRRGKADDGSGGIGDGLAGMLSGDGDSNATKAKVKTPSESDIDVVSSSRSAEDIVKVVRQRTPGLRHIYNKFLKQKSGFQGSVTLKFTIAPGGEVVSISIVSSMTGYDKFDDEIKTAVSRWKFGKVKSGSTTVVIPFTFSQEK